MEKAGGGDGRKRPKLFYSLVSCAVFAGVLLLVMYSLNIAGMNTSEKLIKDWYERVSGTNP